MNLIKELVYRLRAEYTTERLLKMGMKVGKNFKRLNGVILDPGHCWLIDIGDNVTIAPRVHVLCHDASTKEFLGYTKVGRVKIGDQVFVGAESVILPGVTIGNRVIIGANSTVTKDIPDGVVVAGSPARVICTVDDYLAKESKKMKTFPVYGQEYTLAGNINAERKEKMQKELEEQMGFVE